MVATRPTVVLLEPLPVARPWGGTRVARRFGWNAPGPEPIGEWWLASTRSDAPTRLRGTTIDLATWLEGPGTVLGYRAETFPLLLKFLDCEEILSLQVHPSDTVARRSGLPRGKTEAWYVVEAEPGAGVYLGTADGVTPRALLERVRAGAGDDEVRSLLRRIEVSAEDTLLVEAGTVHAIDRGLVLFEVQQNSDTTHRIHDWGRGRPVHLEQAAASVVHQPPAHPVRKPTPPSRWVPLVRGHAFGMWRARTDDELDYEPAADLGLVTVIAGRGEVLSGEQAVPIEAGDTLLVVGAAVLAADDDAELDLLATEPPP